MCTHLEYVFAKSGIPSYMRLSLDRLIKKRNSSRFYERNNQIIKKRKHENVHVYSFQ